MSEQQTRNAAIELHGLTNREYQKLDCSAVHQAGLAGNRRCWKEMQYGGESTYLVWVCLFDNDLVMVPQLTSTFLLSTMSGQGDAKRNHTPVSRASTWMDASPLADLSWAWESGRLHLKIDTHPLKGAIELDPYVNVSWSTF